MGDGADFWRPFFLNYLLVFGTANIAAGVNHSGVADRNAGRFHAGSLGRREE
jgi:hypothetical protein